MCIKKIDVLVNSAGIVALAPAENLSLEAWNRTININLSGTFLCLKQSVNLC